ncbi:MAG: hypothetical protein MZV70_11785 [Desulfobacterales bacterium]|nr:hypothetical protein [Desulfobacterales bacterium]
MNFVAPLMRNSMLRSVFPEPALPTTSVGLPFGRPPPVISSSPEIPVRHFSSPSSSTSLLPDG